MTIVLICGINCNIKNNYCYTMYKKYSKQNKCFLIENNQNRILNLINDSHWNRFKEKSFLFTFKQAIELNYDYILCNIDSNFSLKGIDTICQTAIDNGMKIISIQLEIIFSDILAAEDDNLALLGSVESYELRNQWKSETLFPRFTTINPNAYLDADIDIYIINPITNKNDQLRGMIDDAYQWIIIKGLDEVD